MFDTLLLIALIVLGLLACLVLECVIAFVIYAAIICGARHDRELARAWAGRRVCAHCPAERYT